MTMDNKVLIEKFPDVIKYLIEKQVLNDVNKVSLINIGASGSKVFDITDRNGRFVVKQSDKSTNAGCKREYDFYLLTTSKLNDDVPKIVFAKESNELGHIIVFPFYKK